MPLHGGKQPVEVVAEGDGHAADRVEPLHMAQPHLQFPPFADGVGLDNREVPSVVDHVAGHQFDRQPAFIAAMKATLQGWRRVEGD